MTAEVISLFAKPCFARDVRQAAPQSPTSFATDDLEALAQAFAKSPRGHFETSINRLISCGHIDLGHAILMVYRDFRWDHTPPSPEQLGKCAGLLAKVPAEDPHAAMLARRAFIALGAMRFDPVTVTPEAS